MLWLARGPVCFSKHFKFMVFKSMTWHVELIFVEDVTLREALCFSAMDDTSCSSTLVDEAFLPSNCSKTVKNQPCIFLWVLSGCRALVPVPCVCPLSVLLRLDNYCHVMSWNLGDWGLSLFFFFTVFSYCTSFIFESSSYKTEGFFRGKLLLCILGWPQTLCPLALAYPVLGL
jgi:hypothetical protein